MNKRIRFAVLSWIVALLAMVSACTHTSPIAVSPETKPTTITAKDEPRVPDEYLIKLSPDADRVVIAEYYGKYGIRDIFALGGETYLLVLHNDPGPQTVQSLVFEDDRILAVQPNIIYWHYRSGSIVKNKNN